MISQNIKKRNTYLYIGINQTGVPFLIRYPEKIPMGKVITSASSSVDFAPTILSLMGIDYTPSVFQGSDQSKNFLINEGDSQDEIRFMTASWKGPWIAAFNSRYKLVISDDVPWLFDMGRDPDELYNFYKENENTPIVNELKTKLHEAMIKYDFAARKKTLIWNWPACVDSRDHLAPIWKHRVCADLSLPQYQSGCAWDEIKIQCPFVCGACCEDSKEDIWVDKAFRSCESVSDYCSDSAVLSFCPATCGSCD